MSTVTVIKGAKSQNVVNASSTNPAEGWVMLEQVEEVNRKGYIFENKRRGFLRGPIDTLNRKGLSDKQVLTGRIVYQDQLTPVIAANPAFGLRIPQVGKTVEIRNAVREACTKAGLAYQQSGQDIYRQAFYSPYPEGHSRYEADVILSPDNLDEVAAVVATVTAGMKTPAPKDNSVRIAELKAIPKAKRTPDQVEELTELPELA